MKLFISTKKIISRALLSIGITTISITNAISAANGTTLARSQSSLQLTDFSHVSTEILPFQSAFAYVLTKNNFAIIKSDPLFVTGTPVLFHSLAPQIPAFFTSKSAGNSVTAPFQYDSVTGNVFGQNNFTYSESIPNRLSSVNLSSASDLSVDNTNHLISTVGQSGINLSFFLEPEEKLTFDFQSTSALESRTNDFSTTTVSETQVMYFFTQPADVEINNGILMLSLYPQLHLSANDPRIEVGLLELTTNLTSEGISSGTINYNRSPEESSDYFLLEDRQNLEDNISGTFEYRATQPTIFNLVAYSSNSATSSRSTKIPESSTILSLIYFSSIVICARLVKQLTF